MNNELAMVMCWYEREVSEALKHSGDDPEAMDDSYDE